ncbi:MAG: hypothetical protein MUD03_09900 [Pirellula sp.]|nr:hypothetical protein [Pirellula sp.]
MLQASPLQAPASEQADFSALLQQSDFSVLHADPFSQQPDLVTQQSHAQVSQLHTPVSQQHEPSSQHCAQTHSALLAIFKPP